MRDDLMIERAIRDGELVPLNDQSRFYRTANTWTAWEDNTNQVERGHFEGMNSIWDFQMKEESIRLFFLGQHWKNNFRLRKFEYEDIQSFIVFEWNLLSSLNWFAEHLPKCDWHQNEVYQIFGTENFTCKFCPPTNRCLRCSLSLKKFIFSFALLHHRGTVQVGTFIRAVYATRERCLLNSSSSRLK